MRPYVSILSARFRMLLQYRLAAFAGCATQLFWGLIRVMIFEAFYRSSAHPPPLRLDEMVTYVWLGQAFLGLLPWTGDSELRGMIRSGTVVYELLRPVDLYSLWYSRAVAMRLAPTLLRMAPIFLIAGPFLGLGAPASWEAAGSWLLTMVGALLLSAAVTTLITIFMLWTIAGEGAFRLVSAIVPLLSGLVVPLPFFPSWAQPILYFLPFRGLMDIPFRTYLGNITAAELGGALAHQAIWTVVLVLLGRGLLARGTRRLVVQGG